MDDAAVTSEDQSALSSLPDQTITVNVAAISDLCSQWQAKIDALNIDVDKVANSFKPLTNYGILTNYVTGLSTALAAILQSVKTITTTIGNSSGQHDESENVNPGDTYAGPYGNSPPGGNYQDPGTGVDNGDDNLDIDPNDRIESLTYQDYLGLSTLLYNFFKKTGIDLSNLDDETYKKIKDLILSSDFISAELKEKLGKLPDSYIKSLLKLMDQNKTFENFTKPNVEFLEEYIGKLANINKTTVDKYLTDTANKSVVFNDLYYLNNAITYLDVASKQSNVGEILQNVLDGKNVDTMGEKNADAIRNLISFLADKKKLSNEEFVKKVTRDDLKTVIDAGYLVNDVIRSDTDSLQKLLKTLTS